MSENYSSNHTGWKPLGGKVAIGESVSSLCEPKFLKYRDTISSMMPINTPEKAIAYRKAWKDCYGEDLDKYLGLMA
jgi:hypothetical protein